MKTLLFKCRGEWYKVKENGDMLQENNTYNKWDKNWRLLGVSFHHCRNNTDMGVKELFDNPEKMIKGYVWDIDHGTTRFWGGQYYGKLPRVESAYIK